MTYLDHIHNGDSDEDDNVNHDSSSSNDQKNRKKVEKISNEQYSYVEDLDEEEEERTPMVPKDDRKEEGDESDGRGGDNRNEQDNSRDNGSSSGDTGMSSIKENQFEQLQKPPPQTDSERRGSIISVSNEIMANKGPQIPTKVMAAPGLITLLDIALYRANEGALTSTISAANANFNSGFAFIKPFEEEIKVLILLLIPPLTLEPNPDC
eukprot:CAMPEP_0184857142 /NCGR_PEP_ID=MMETSP0580-20130426/2302_1 /TAXON_ID=1118495 /ORGANISM="Dactyliosolen fragilissimus" /LENGTH=208 /DNA_ID=CAMNT_0027352561 /DNA_START=490 /DNA_END=1114 /DNA_ORIENTATION=+